MAKYTIDEKIAAAQERHDKLKMRLEKVSEELEKLKAKKDAEKNKEILEALEKTGKSKKDIIAFLSE